MARHRKTITLSVQLTPALHSIVTAAAQDAFLARAAWAKQALAQAAARAGHTLDEAMPMPGPKPRMKSRADAEHQMPAA
jgi:hypothetical protein